MGIARRTIAAAVLLVLVACAGADDRARDGGADPRAWLATVCGATRGWVDEIVALNQELQGDLDAPNVRQLKDTMVGYFEDILAATDEMIAEVDGAGVPDVDGGGATADAISSGLRDARDVLQEARDEAVDLPTGDRRAFGEELQVIGQDVQTSLGEVGRALGEMDSPELDRLAENVPACRELNEL